MLDRKIYQFSQEGKEVWIYLRDQGRWLDRCRILDQAGDLVVVRYETEDEDEICSWEEIIRIDSIGAVAQRLSTIPKGDFQPSDLPTAEDYPESEHIDTPYDRPSEDDAHDKSTQLKEPIDNGNLD